MWPAHVCPRVDPEEGAVLCSSKETSSVHRWGSFSQSWGRLPSKVWPAALIYVWPWNMRSEWLCAWNLKLNPLDFLRNKMIENSKQFLMCKILKIKICISTLIQCITSAQVSESVLAAEMSINPTGVWAFKSWGRQHVFGVTGQIIPSRLSAYCILNVLKRYSTPAPPLGSFFRLQKHLVCYGTLKKKQKGYKVLIGIKVWRFSGYFLYHWLIFCCMNIVHTPMLIWLEGIGERWQLQEEMWLLKKNLAPPHSGP